MAGLGELAIAIPSPFSTVEESPLLCLREKGCRRYATGEIVPTPYPGLRCASSWAVMLVAPAGLGLVGYSISVREIEFLRAHSNPGTGRFRNHRG
jgi:hypothetical protein